MRRRSAIAIVVGSVVLAALPVADAVACSCAGQSTQETYRSMDAAFTGKLLSIKASVDGRFETFRYRVKRDYKGNLGETVKVRMPALSSCRVDGDTVGRRYSLFLYRSADGLRRTKTGPWTSNACLETTRKALEEAARGAESSGAGGSTGCTGGSA